MKEEVIIAGAALDVQEDNYDEFDHEIDPAKLSHKLKQVNKRKGITRNVQFYGLKHLLISIIKNKKGKATNFHINLACLSPKPKHNITIVWHWLYAAIATLALTVLFVYLDSTQMLKSEYSYIGGTISITSGIIFFLLFINSIQNEYVFKSYYGKARIFSIENKKPNAKFFKAFFTLLKQKINKTQSNMTVPERLVAELKVCRRLRDEGIITDKTYTAVRKVIFKHKQYKT